MGANLDPVVAAQADVAFASRIYYIVVGPMQMSCGEIKLRKSRLNEGGKNENATRKRKDCSTIVFGCWLFFLVSFSDLSFREEDCCTLYLRRNFSVGQ